MKWLVIACILIVASGCATTQSYHSSIDDPMESVHPSWSKNAVMYELNAHNFTAEGTFRAAESHLPRLRNLGVDIIRLTSLHPSIEGLASRRHPAQSEGRKYHWVNSQIGTVEDIKRFIAHAHALSMYVIIDWSDAHHAEYGKDPQLRVELAEVDVKHAEHTPFGKKPSPRKRLSDESSYMFQAMKFWVEEMDVDGFRANIVGVVSHDFWSSAREQLSVIKPVLMMTIQEEASNESLI